MTRFDSFLYQLLQHLNPITAKGEDNQRVQYIQTILLLGSIVLCTFAFVLTLTQSLGYAEVFRGNPPSLFLLFLLVLVVLYLLNRQGHVRVVSYIFLSIYFFPTLSAAYSTGPDSPQVLLTLVLVILMSGILISNHFTLFMSVFTGSFLIGLTYLQQRGFITYPTYWRFVTPSFSDILLNVLTFALIMIVSWLSNLEIHKSLRRARASEKALKKERDLLEDKVQERTRQLRRTQMERFLEVYHFADFGRLAAGLLHDLANPLHLVSLNLSQLQEKYEDVLKGDVKEVTAPLQRAMVGTQRMEAFIQAARKQVQKQDLAHVFSPAEEIRQVIQMVSSKAQKAHVDVRFVVKKNLQLYGNPIKFYQLMTNLLSNAIDAYDGIAVAHKNKRQVVITQMVKSNTFRITVQDWGVGITPDHIKHIFEPFFTTKSFEKGTGIGLVISKEVVEKEFGGKISVTSDRVHGTVFTISIPLGTRRSSS